MPPLSEPVERAGDRAAARPGDRAPGPWLVVIDMQRAFADADSAWRVPRYAEIEPVIDALGERYAGRTVHTRFVPDPAEPDQWARYYDRWSTMRRPQDSPLWELTRPLPGGTPVVSLPTFGKWGGELAALTAGAPLVLCGVATDCCVLATALAAADAGRAVTVVSDACAGVDDRSHGDTLRLLGLLSPMVEVCEARSLPGPGG
ncbi:cysteine hydrolase family protein [Streptomyces sp. NBC_01089]|uniref:cysteine hydrolase family protein n=1 Tax=Streptomyces sp. NBC_01089 TaxID=2903747 RepID=UPI00386FA973|nr:cysteine hydrolase [Streptomyces sp. NBC_01089]